MSIKTQLRRRPAADDTHLPASLPPLLRRLYALRGVQAEQELERSVKGMLPWQQLDGIDDAVSLLQQALADGRRIMVVGDFDADGATGTALTVLALRSMGGAAVDYLVPNRFEDGYGLSPEVVEQAAARGAELIVTVDNGNSSHAGVDVAHAKGMQVLVTDHHLPGETLPAAEAIVNPNLRGCAFPSKSLAGVGVALLLSDDIAQARMLANDLDALNQTRREIEQGMQVEALQLCDQLERTSTELPYGLAMYHPEWHQGVVGILASRIKERFHRPVIAFAPAGEGILKGSGRSVPGLHMRDALERLDMLNPGLMMKFGGHAMAAGLSLEEAKFDEFRQRFGELVGEWLDPAMLEGVIWSDGELAMQELSLTTAELLREGGPWGQAFPEPTFDGKFRILQQRLVGEKHLKLMVEPLGGGPLLDGIAFNVDTTLWPDSSVREVELAYKLDVNEFRGNRNVQLLIQHLWPR
ncbi:DHH family phosphoesterase [Serratia nematodiphila]